VKHPPRLALGLLLIAAASLSYAGCGRNTHADRAGADPRVDLTWTLRPATSIVGPATLTLSLHAPSGEPITKATVRIEGYMTHAGMAPLFAEAVERTPGVYEAAFAFTMQGDWVLLASISLPDGTRVERRIDVANVRPSSG
jgi:hypothetical protein